MCDKAFKVKLHKDDTIRVHQKHLLLAFLIFYQESP